MEDSERKQRKLPAEAWCREHAVYVVMVMGSVRVINEHQTVTLTIYPDCYCLVTKSCSTLL